VATAGLAAPAIAQGVRRLKMVTDWVEGMTGFHASAVRFARTVETATAGRIGIEVFPAGKLVPAFQTFDAVSAGVADLYHSAEYYWEKKSRAFDFFAAVPFGFTAQELFGWVHYGGGQELWDELSGRFNIKALLCLNTGTQMGGWFNTEIRSADDFKGLRYRMPDPGAEVLRRLGAIVVTLPGGEIVQALKSGAIDASEWVGPWPDMAMGLHKAASYYYYAGFHEPGTGIAVGINKAIWQSLDGSDRQIIEAVAASEYSRSLAEFNTNNASWLGKLQAEGDVRIMKFPDAVLKAFLVLSKDVVAEIGAADPLSRKIYESYQKFRAGAIAWSNIAEHAFLNARAPG
jgi:TRAP-type mannitol/chloroaromatic compound transport system substrate-binding protein